jgi:hypothetical protein
MSSFSTQSAICNSTRKEMILMGAWGGLCIFDHTRYVELVVPALRAGENDPHVQHALTLMQRIHPRRMRRSFQGLAQLAPYYDPLLTTCSLGRSFFVCDGVVAMQPDRAQQCADSWIYEDVADLFECLVTRHTISHYTVLGLSFTSVEQLFPAVLDIDTTTQSLLDLLDQRARYWAASTGGYGEGFQGWLDPAETALLARGLAAFGPGAALGALHPLLDYWSDAESEYAWHRRRIAQFIMTLQQAVTLGRGLLWGRDLRVFYSPRELFDDGEPAPMALAYTDDAMS